MKYCQKCGKKNVDDANYCFYCGNKFNGNKRNNIIIILSMLIITSLLFVFIYYFIIKNSKDGIIQEKAFVELTQEQTNSTIIPSITPTDQSCEEFTTLPELNISYNKKYRCLYGVAIVAELIFPNNEKTYFVIAYMDKENDYKILRFNIDGDYSKKNKNCIVVSGLLETKDGNEFTLHNDTAKIFTCSDSQKEIAPFVSISSSITFWENDNLPDLYDWDLYFSNE